VFGPLIVLALGAGCGGSSVAGGRGDCPEGESVSCRCDDGRLGTRLCEESTCTCPDGAFLEAHPDAVDFGDVTPGETQDATVWLWNTGASPVALGGIEFAGAGAEALRLETEAPAEIPGQGRVPVTVVFAPTAPGNLDARLRILPADAALAALEVPLAGRAPGAVLACSPSSVQFGDVPLGASGAKAVVCTNAGVVGRSDDARLPEPGFAVEAPFSARLSAPWPTAGLAVGEAVTFEVGIEGRVPGAAAGVLAIDSTAGAVEVPVAATVLSVACELRVPAHASAGVGEVNETVDIVVRNPSPDFACTVERIGLCPGTDPGYSLPAGPFEDLTVPPGGEFRFLLAIDVERLVCGDLEIGGCIEYVFAAETRQTTELSCPLPGVVAAPRSLDFGEVPQDCSSRAKEVQVYNVTPDVRTFRRAELQDGWNTEFEVRSQPDPGTEILPGDFVSVSVAYLPVDASSDNGTLLVWTDEEPEPAVVNLGGWSRGAAVLTDTFVQRSWPKLDLLVVLDNGTTMTEEAARFVDELGDLPASLGAQNVDFHLAVTTTGLAPATEASCPGGAAGGEDGRFFPVDGARPRIVSNGLPNATSVWRANLAVGTCQSAAPQPLEAALRALTAPVATSLDDPRHPEGDDGNLGFLRPDAHLSVLVVSDRDDASPGTPASYYQAIQELKGVRNTHLFAFHTIGGGAAGCTADDGRSGAALYCAPARPCHSREIR
jgi:hypothetical protein